MRDDSVAETRWQRQARAVVLALAGPLVLSLAGCVPLDLGGGGRPGYLTSDLFGTWESANGKASITFGRTGEVTVKNWPENLSCQDPRAEYTEDIDWTRGMNLGGTWTGGEGAASGDFVVRARLDSGCEGHMEFLVHDSPDSALVLGAPMNSLIDPDAIEPNQEVLFHKASGA